MTHIWNGSKRSANKTYGSAAIQQNCAKNVERFAVFSSIQRNRERYTNTHLLYDAHAYAYVQICLYVCVCLNGCLCMSVCVCACVRGRKRERRTERGGKEKVTTEKEWLWIFAYEYKTLYVCGYICIHIYTYTHIHICNIHVYKYTYIYIHVCIDVYVYQIYSFLYEYGGIVRVIHHTNLLTHHMHVPHTHALTYTCIWTGPQNCPQAYLCPLGSKTGLAWWGGLKGRRAQNRDNPPCNWQRATDSSAEKVGRGQGAL